MVPLTYNYRNLVVRWRTTVMTASGFTLVVMALVVMLAFVNGVVAVCRESGQAENVIVLKKGNFDEVLSQMDRQLVLQVELTPGVMRNAEGQFLASREAFMVVTQWNDDQSDYRQVQTRGVYPNAFEVHSHVKLVAGRMFERNRREVIVGSQLAADQKLVIGSKLNLGEASWEVVGIFRAQGACFESEVWGYLDELAGYFHRDGVFSSVVLTTASADAAQRTVNDLNDGHLAVEARTETEYYEQQAQQTNVIRTGAIVIAAFMALGAICAVTNTMFAAIGERITDIAVLRLLGYRGTEILACFLLEAMLISILGGGVGLGLGYMVNGFSLFTALSTRSVAFAFQVSPSVLGTGAAFALVMGAIGGLLPAISAMRVRPLESLR